MIHYKRYESYAQIPSEWDRLALRDVFLQRTYLKAIEEASPATIVLYYIAIFDAHSLVGIAVIQRVSLYAKDMFRSADSWGMTNLKKLIASVLKGNVLVVGNLTHTGQHGISFNLEHITLVQFLNTLFIAIDDLVKMIKIQNGKSIRAIAFKDYFVDDALHNAAEFLNRKSFYHFNVQPNMVMTIPSSWIDHTDYVAALSKKYKTRYKRTRNKFGPVRMEELSEEAIFNNAERLYQLYRTVCNKASFNTFILPQHHFYIFKDYLNENFKVFAYYLDDKIVGFCTLIKNNDSLET